MSLIGPDFIALQVRDPDASARFWETRLGLVRAERSPPDAVVFDTRPIPFALRRPLVDLDAGGPPGHGVSLWLAAESAATIHGEVAEHGLEIVRPLADGPFGRAFTFRDPDGYLITVHDAR